MHDNDDDDDGDEDEDDGDVNGQSSVVSKRRNVHSC